MISLPPNGERRDCGNGAGALDQLHLSSRQAEIERVARQLATSDFSDHAIANILLVNVNAVRQMAVEPA